MLTGVAAMLRVAGLLADALAIEGEKSTVVLASMLRIVWLYESRPEGTWSGGRPG